MKHKRLKIAITLAIVFTALGVVAFESRKSVEYYKHVDELMKSPEEWAAKDTLQVHGFVVPGSIHEEIKDQRAFQSFDIDYHGKTLSVRHRGVKPDTFKDQAETVVKGTLKNENGAWVFYALDDEPGIMAKCPSKYNGGNRT